MCEQTTYRGLLAAMWTETFFYGIHALLFAGYAYIYLSSDTNGRAKQIMILTATVMFAISTALMLNDFICILLTPAFSIYTECTDEEYGLRNGVADNAWEANVYNLTNVVSAGLFITNQFLADMLLTYRCFVVWQNTRKIIVLPAVMVLVTAGAGYFETYIAVLIYLVPEGPSKATSDGMLHLNSLVRSLSYAVYALALTTNLLVTGLIAIRVWWITRELEVSLGKRMGRRYRAAIAILVESGAIYSGAQVILLTMTFESPKFYGSIAMCAVNQLVGIVPTVIMVRVALARNSPQASVRESNIYEFIPHVSGPVSSQTVVAESGSTSSVRVAQN